MEPKESKCPKCGLARQAQKAGTITQWINTCKCGLDESQVSDFLSLKVCANCGKRIKSTREGSMTQWIFRSDLCDCDRPSPQDRKISSEPDQEIEQSSKVSDEIEIAVNQATFPLDRYKPLKEIGKGSIGLVYLCRDRLLGTKVALKCLSTIDNEPLIAFQKEAKVTCRLEHPNIVKVIDFGASAEGAPYMVLEYIEGTTLKGLIEESGPLSIQNCVSLFSRMCNALSYAHEKGIYHRDLTSSNIIVTDSTDKVKLVDFGIALAQQATQEPTIVQGKTVAGTPSYMPPDQVRGLEYTQVSEVYSLGCVLFEALTGKPPYTAETALEVISMHANRELPDPVTLRSELADYPELTTILKRALEKDPANRYQSMDDFESALLSTTEESLPEARLETPNVVKNSRGGKSKFFYVGLFSIAVLCFCVFGLNFFIDRISHMFSTETTTAQKDGRFLSKDMFNQDVDNSKDDDKFNERSLDYIIGEPKKGASGFNSLKNKTETLISPGITRFNFTSVMFGQCIAHFSQTKVRFDWQAIMCFFVQGPKYNTLIVQDLISLHAYSTSVRDYYKYQWRHDIDQKIENVKLVKEETILGYPCKKYTCLVDGVKMTFSTTKAFTDNPSLEKTCCNILGVPAGYGIPMLVYKTYRVDQARKERIIPVQRALSDSKGVKERTILWFKMNVVEKDRSDLPVDQLFPDQILNGKLEHRIMYKN